MIDAIVVAQTAPNTAAVWIALIGSLTTIATLIVTHLLSGRTRAQQTRKIDRQSEKVDDVKVLVDGRMSQLLDHNKALDGRLLEMLDANKTLRRDVDGLRKLLAHEKQKPNPQKKAAARRR